MPIYAYECKKCAITEEALRSVVERLMAPYCEKCGEQMQFILSFSARQGPSYPYVDVHMDHKPVEITSLAQRKKELKKRGLQDCGVRRGMRGQWI